MSQDEALLEVEGLTLEFPAGRDQWVTVVDNLNLNVSRGEVTALVGESGSGKTVTSLALLGLLPFRGGRIAAGSVRFHGAELVGLSAREWRAIRGRRMAMIFQQPVLALNPAFTVGDQIAETARAHLPMSRKAARARAVEMLDRVGITNPAQRARDYPHMFSGGMCQRVMIAQALVCEPELLIADEPTTALDVTVQAMILALLRDIQAEMGISILLITHDLGVVSETADRIDVMYGGQIVEEGSADEVLHDPRHPYTETLIAAVPTSRMERFPSVPGTGPTPGHMPPGCRFAPRCSHATSICISGQPHLAAIGDDRFSRCVRVPELYPHEATKLENPL